MNSANEIRQPGRAVAVMAAWLLGLSMACERLAAEQRPVGRFSEGMLDSWESKSFDGDTRYRIVELDGARVLEATSEDSASGLFFERRIDLRKTPWINWSWRVEKRLPPLDETSKKGDDYSARIYAVVDGGFAFWKSRAINYVWSSRPPGVGDWPNAFAGDRVMMVAVRSAADPTGEWHSERRNLREEFGRLFGDQVDAIDAIAIMTDTDNASGRTRAYYGDIWFSSD